MTETERTDLSKLSDEQLAKLALQTLKGSLMLRELGDTVGFQRPKTPLTLPEDIAMEMKRRGFTVEESKDDSKTPPSAPASPPTPPPPADSASSARPPPAPRKSTGFPLLDEFLATTEELEPVIGELSEASFDGLRSGVRAVIIVREHAKKVLDAPSR